MADMTLDDVMANSDFHSLTLPEKNAFLMENIPEFARGRPADRMELLDSLHYDPQLGENRQVQSFDSPPVTSIGQAAKAAAQGVGDVIQGVGRGAIGLASMPYQTISASTPSLPKTWGEGVATVAAGPLGLQAKRMIWDPMQATAEQSRGETGIKKTAMQIASGVPVVGPMAAGFANQIQNPEDIGKAAGELLAYKELPAEGKLPWEKAAGWWKEHQVRVAPQKVWQHLTNALRPGRTNRKWTPAVSESIKSGDLPSAIQEARQVDPSTGELTAEPLTINSPTTFWQATHQRLSKLWQGEIQPRLDIAGITNINKGTVAGKLGTLQEGISAKVKPKLYETTGSEERAFYSSEEPMSHSQAQQRVADVNSQLDSYFKNPGGDVEATAPKIANLLLEREGLNAEINAGVEQLTGEGIGPLKKRWSNMKSVDEQAFKAKIAEETQRNPGLMDAVRPYIAGKLAGATVAVLSGHPAGAAVMATYGLAELGAKEVLKGRGSPAHQITKAADLLSKMPGATKTPLTMPSTPLPPKGQMGLPVAGEAPQGGLFDVNPEQPRIAIPMPAHKLLTEGEGIGPIPVGSGIPDTSSVRSIQAMPSVSTKNLLPAARFIDVPPERVPTGEPLRIGKTSKGETRGEASKSNLKAEGEAKMKAARKRKEAQKP